MVSFSRDENRAVVLGSVSSADSTTLVELECDATNKALNVNLANATTPSGDSMIDDTNDALNVTVVSGASNTQYAEDAEHASGNTGTMALAVRADTAATTADSDGDYVPLLTDANGRLHVLDQNSSAIKDAVETIDNAIAGTEMQVDVVTMPTTTVDATDLDIRDLTSTSDSVEAVISDGTDTASITAAASDSDPDLDGTNLLGTHALLSARKDGDTTIGLTAADGTHNALHVAISDGEGIANVNASNQLEVSVENAVTVDLGSNNDVSLNTGSNVVGKVRLVTANGDEITEDTDDSMNVTIVADDVGIGGGTQYTLGDDTYTEATSVGTLAGAVRNDTLATLADTDNELAPLQVNATGALYTAISGNIPDTAAGDLAAINSAVSGSLDVSGATVTVDGSVTADLGENNDVTIDGSSIVKAEDSQHSDGDDGVMALAVRNDTLAALGASDGDYAPLQVNATGALYIDVADGGVLEGHVDGIETVLGTIDTDTGNIATYTSGAETALEIIDDTVFTDDTSTHTTGTTKGIGIMAVANPTDTAVAANDIGMPSMTLDRRLYTENSYSYDYIAAAGVNEVTKASPGFLHAILVGDAVASSVIEVSDHASDGDGNVVIYLAGDTLGPALYPVNMYMSTGICSDITNQTHVTMIYR